MKNRDFFDYASITLKGMAMGAADVVPGVSGGTIAFISGIYEELLDSISAFDFNLIKIVKKEGFKSAWNRVNGSFLLSLLSGIGISVASLAKVLSWLLENQPILLWSFFFGLVIASILFVGKQITQWKITTVISLLLGALIAFFITQLQPATSEDPSSLYIVFSGAIAISAMILPGISGAFILVLLGVYHVALNAVHQRDIVKIALFGLGAVLGLLIFSRILKYIFSHYRDLTLAVLTGFIIGALNKIWPWKEVIESTEIGGKLWEKENSISPFHYEGDNQLFLAIGLGILGFALIFILEKWGENRT